MPALFCLITFIIGLFKKEVAYLAVSSVFAIAYSIEQHGKSKSEEEDY